MPPKTRLSLRAPLNLTPTDAPIGGGRAPRKSKRDTQITDIHVRVGRNQPVPGSGGSGLVRNTGAKGLEGFLLRPPKERTTSAAQGESEEEPDEAQDGSNDKPEGIEKVEERDEEGGNAEIVKQDAQADVGFEQNEIGTNRLDEILDELNSSSNNKFVKTSATPVNILLFPDFEWEGGKAKWRRFLRAFLGEVVKLSAHLGSHGGRGPLLPVGLLIIAFDKYRKKPLSVLAKTLRTSIHRLLVGRSSLPWPKALLGELIDGKLQLPAELTYSGLDECSRQAIASTTSTTSFYSAKQQDAMKLLVNRIGTALHIDFGLLCRKVLLELLFLPGSSVALSMFAGIWDFKAVKGCRGGVPIGTPDVNGIALERLEAIKEAHNMDNAEAKACWEDGAGVEYYPIYDAYLALLKAKLVEPGFCAFSAGLKAYWEGKKRDINGSRTRGPIWLVEEVSDWIRIAKEVKAQHQQQYNAARAASTDAANCAVKKPSTLVDRGLMILQRLSEVHAAQGGNAKRKARNLQGVKNCGGAAKSPGVVYPFRARRTLAAQISGNTWRFVQAAVQDGWGVEGLCLIMSSKALTCATIKKKPNILPADAAKRAKRVFESIEAKSQAHGKAKGAGKAKEKAAGGKGSSGDKKGKGKAE
ncbi:hypothetical protein Rhopal_007845-T1 [Rhodotorula paludigena]|uniref:Uncharacterized protein n=1 Tax=Rhodotorula paludigena TaxID=86838 RepID=A0AAV5GWT4_9BASI|nr:hypothetical protein Rhopal_007845-T1 [Rhodotorula paludigena]